VQSNDDQQLGELIQRVLEEMNAPKKGTAYADPYLFQLSAYYAYPGRKYFVITDGQTIYGGGGYGDLPGADSLTCEIQKMYFDRELRGRGWGERLLKHLMKEAKNAKYEKATLKL
jgi:Acetyltransferase (GNAT) family.